MAVLKPYGFILAYIRHEVGEGFVEPKIIPPLHGDEVAEPHVGDLMQEGVEYSLSLLLRE
jgi:hypothetical protein